MTEIEVSTPNSLMGTDENGLWTKEYKDLIVKNILIEIKREEDKKQIEMNKIYENDNLCQICYTNTLCVYHKCKSCENSICIGCIESIKKNCKEGYKVNCPFCRKITEYKDEDLSRENLLLFYNNITKKYNELKEPYEDILKSNNRLDTSVNEMNLYLKSQKKAKEVSYENISDLKGIFHEFICDAREIKEIDRKKKVSQKEENLSLRNYREMYEGQNKYLEYLNKTITKNTNQNEEQIRIINDMNKQMAGLKNEMEEVKNTTKLIYDTLKDPDNKKNLKDKVKKMNAIFEENKDVVNKINTTIVINTTHHFHIPIQ